MTEWLTEKQPVAYETALAAMDARAEAIRAGTANELIWLLEHPPLYTAGTSARESDLMLPDKFPVYQTGRGGQYTYHGPGQRVAYLMLDLKKRQQQPDIKKYIWQLEEVIIRSLGRFDVKGERRAGRVGIWVSSSPSGEAKVAAIGVRIRRWVTMHGIAVNIDPDLSHYAGIVPCGVREHGITSLTKLLGRPVAMEEFDESMKAEWGGVFSNPEKLEAA
jgi:lipoyl(octanoyl) transferase